MKTSTKNRILAHRTALLPVLAALCAALLLLSGGCSSAQGTGQQSTGQTGDGLQQSTEQQSTEQQHTEQDQNAAQKDSTQKDSGQTGAKQKAAGSAGTAEQAKSSGGSMEKDPVSPDSAADGKTQAVDSSTGKTVAEDSAAAGKTQAEDSSAGKTVAEDSSAGETEAEDSSVGETLASQAASGGQTASAAQTAKETKESEKTKKSGKSDEFRGLVVIDPGHQRQANTEQEPIGPGASETKMKVTGGATGAATGVPEYDLVLEIGLQLRDLLQERGYEVIMTRESHDVDISNSQRAQIANEADADIFVRIHANSVGDSSHTGAMTICQTPNNVFNGYLYEQSRALSDCVLNAYTERTGIRYEYVWETDTMSGINWCQVPVTILEMGYLSNQKEDSLMQDPNMQKSMVRGIADGIDAYFSFYPKKEREKTDGEKNEPQDKGDDQQDESSTDKVQEDENSKSKDQEDENSTEKDQEDENSMNKDQEKKQEIKLTRSRAGVSKEKLSPVMEDLAKQLSTKLSKKTGDWSLYLYRTDTGEAVGLNAQNPMVSASLIKLYVAGCYLEKVEKKEVPDKYQKQLYAMLSASDNAATNTLIDVLGMDEINTFIREQGYWASQLNRKMLEKNKTENFTSSQDCGRVLRKVFEGTYVSKAASERVMEALKAQIERNRKKIPAGVPKGIETANKTGELFIKGKSGVTIAIQNDAAVIFAPDRPYILTVMSAVPSGGEEQLHKEIAELSKIVYERICGKTGQNQ